MHFFGASQTNPGAGATGAEMSATIGRSECAPGPHDREAVHVPALRHAGLRGPGQVPEGREARGEGPGQDLETQRERVNKTLFDAT